jgi:His/Glu/Gln/Arg/opine family amino acid ABC transporter permease subunit
VFDYDWNFSMLVPFAGAYYRATIVTLALSVLSFGIGSALGAVLGVIGRPIPGARLLFFLNDCIRAVPVLVLIFLVYFFPSRELLGVEPLSPFWASVVAFSISQAAYTADIVRVAIDQVPKNLLLAGHAVGLEKKDLWRFVVLPDVVRQIAPAQLAFFIGIVRLSSVASVIGCQDVVFVGRIISAQTFRSIEPWLLVTAVYVLLVVPFTVMARELEQSKWLKRRG